MYIGDLIEAIVDNYDETYISNKDKIRTISIKTLGVKTTDFNIPRNKKNALFQEGYRSADNFIKNWDFREYVRRYRT